MKRFLLAALAAVLIMGVFVACGGASDQMTGKYVRSNNKDIYLVFNKDGTVTKHEGDKDPLDGTYVVKDTEIFLTFDNIIGGVNYGPKENVFSLSKNHKTISSYSETYNKK